MMFFNPFSQAEATNAHGTMLPDQSPADIASPLGVTPPQVLAQEAAAGRRGAAWRLLHRLLDNDPQAIAALASFDDDCLAQRLLEWIALGTWAGNSLVVPVSLRSPPARIRLRTLFLPGSGIESLRAERVLTAALHDSRPALRETSASILGLLGSATAAPALIEALWDPVPTVQFHAARALGRTGNPAAVPALLSLIQHAGEQLSNQIFSSLAQLSPVAVPALIESSTSSSPWMRWHGIRALGEIRDPRALPVLVRALADTDQAVAWMAAKGLVPFGRRSVGPVLRLLLSAPVTPWLAETASYVLSSQHDPRLKPYLESVIQHMHGIEFQIGTLLSAHKALSHLIADDLIEEGSQGFRASNVIIGRSVSRALLAKARPSGSRCRSPGRTVLLTLFGENERRQ